MTNEGSNTQTVYTNVADFFRKRRWFIEALFNLQENATWERLVIFFLGLLLSGIWINYLYALFTTTKFQPAPPFFRIFVFSLMAVIVVEIVARSYLHRRSLQYNVSDAEVAPASKWVITLISPWDGESDHRKEKVVGPDFITNTNLENIADLIRHHEKRLEKLYLVGTFQINGVKYAYKKLADELRNPQNTPILQNIRKFDPDELLVKVKLEEVVKELDERRGSTETTPATTADACFEAVSSIIDDNLQTSRVSLSDIAVDITAGLKSMTMGLGIAALTYGLSLTYRSSPRSISGVPVETLEQKKFVKVETGIRFARVVHIDDTYSSHPDKDHQ